MFFLATTTLNAGAGLADTEQRITDDATYALFAQFLSRTTIFSVKFSFLLYFRALMYRLPKVEAWGWFSLVVFISIEPITISGALIVCPHTGPSELCVFQISLPTRLFADYKIVHCVSNPGFLRREHGFLYYTVALDIVTDISCE